jgi:hypothetical protein
VRLLRGTFRSGNEEGAVFDAQAEGGPALYVNRACQLASVLEMSWRVVGPGHRDLWPAYVRALQANALEAFFRDRSVSEAERDEVASVIGYSRSQLIHRLRPVLLAVLRRSVSDYSVEQFLDAIGKHAGSDAELAGWLNVEESVLRKLLDGTRGMSSDERFPELLPLLDLTVAEWQECRHALGMGAIRFQESCKEFSMTVAWVIAALRAMVAHDAGGADVDFQ